MFHLKVAEPVHYFEVMKYQKRLKYERSRCRA